MEKRLKNNPTTKARGGQPAPATYKSDKIFNNVLLGITIGIVVVLFGIFLTLFISSFPAFKEYGGRFFVTRHWNEYMPMVHKVEFLEGETRNLSPVRVEFSKTIDTKTVNQHSVFIKDSGNKPVAVKYSFDYFVVTNTSIVADTAHKGRLVTNYTYSYETNAVILTPTEEYKNGFDYILSINRRVRDRLGIKLADQYKWDFSVPESDDGKLSVGRLIFARSGKLVMGYDTEIKRWFGSLPFVLGTLLTSILALLISLPFSLAIAIFLGEYHTAGALSTTLKTTNELLAGIPSIIYGFWAFFFLVPLWGSNVFTSSVVLAIMIIPYSASLAREVISLVPPSLKEAAFAMGATRFEVVRKVIIPYASSGIFAGILLAFGRALGETMAVTMVIGNANKIPTGIFSKGQTIASLIANEYAEAEGLRLASLTELGLILFIITMLFGLLGRYIIKRLSVKEY